MENKTKPSIYQQPNFDLSHMNLNSNSSFAFFFIDPYALTQNSHFHFRPGLLPYMSTSKTRSNSPETRVDHWDIKVQHNARNKGGGEIILTRGEQG